MIVESHENSFKIESGWDYVEDAKDMVKELPRYLNPKVYARKTLSKFGLNPKKDSDWLK